MLVGQGLGGGHRGHGVGHVEDGGHAAEGRRGGAAGEVFLLGIAGVAEVDVDVDGAGQDVQPGRVERFACGRHLVGKGDRGDQTVLDREAGPDLGVW